MIGRILLFVWLSIATAAYAAPEDIIQRVKASIVAVGTYLPSRSPQFSFRSTGFVVGDGTLIITNAHSLAQSIDIQQMERFVISLPNSGKQGMEVEIVSTDRQHDLALLRIKGPPLPALAIRSSDNLREGQHVYFTGYPIGAVLGLYPATHRAMVSALTPIAIPAVTSTHLDPKTIRRLTTGVFNVIQLDGTAYPGNSGSPLYDPETGEVVGVINMVFVKGTKEAAITQPSGITYAIPSTHVQAILKGQ
ncbi:MAG TPA: serine protease [Burkholderiales bacterium]|nr:serine protease [Burkholderiales bacterium]